MKKILCTLTALICAHHIDGATLVYNLKIRRAFSASTLISGNKKKRVAWLLTALPIWYQRKRTITGPTLPEAVHDTSVSAGALLNARLLAPHNWWAELTTGIEKQSSHYKFSNGFNTSRTGFDDIVLSIGKNWFFKDKNGQFVLYGLAGAPTKWDVSECDRFDPQVGSRFYGAGVGGEISYSFMHTAEKSLIGIIQTRFIHFFNRNWAPIIPCPGHLQPGNITDLALLLRYRHLQNMIEVGYNPTFFTHQAVVLPTQKISTDTFVRNSVFANYLYLMKEIPGLHVPGALGAGINIGRSRQFKTKILGLWLNISILL